MPVSKSSVFIVAVLAGIFLLAMVTSKPKQPAQITVAEEGSVAIPDGLDRDRPVVQEDSGLRDMRNNTDLDNRPPPWNESVEKVRAYWNSRPCNLKHSNKKIGTKEYFDEVEAKKYKVEPHIPGFARYEQWKGKKVLEVGCGMATEGVNFARAGADYHGIDLTDEGIKLAKQRFKVFGLDGDLQQCNAEELTSCFPKGTKFDLIYSFGVIHHSPHPETIVAEMKKLLKVGGTLKLMVYSRISFKLFWVMKETGIWDFSKSDALIGKYSEAKVGSPVTYVYTFDELRDLIGPDFKVQEMYKDHIFKYDVEEYKKGNYVVDKMWDDVPEPLFRAFEKELGWHTMVTAKYAPADR